MGFTKKEWDAQMDRMKNDSSKLAEHYDHFVLIVRTPKDGVQWHYSDASFAIGATERMKQSIFEMDARPTQVEIVG